MPLGGAAILGAVALGKGIFGAVQKGKANSLAAQNKRPDYTIPPEYYQNVAMARQMAQVGLPQQQYNNQLNGINQNQAGAISVLSRSANPGSAIASIVRAGDSSTNSLNAQDAAAKVNNQRLLMQQNGILGQQELAQQQYNKFGKYQENAAAIRALNGAGDQNINGALNMAAGAGLQYLGAKTDSDPSDTTRYAGGNLFQRATGGLKAPLPGLPDAQQTPISYGEIAQGLSQNPFYRQQKTPYTGFGPQYLNGY